MNKKLIVFAIIWLVVIAGVFWWWQSGKEETKEVEEKPSVTETATATGKVIPPTGVSPENFTIIGLATTTTPDKNGEFTVGKIYKEGVTVVAAMPTEEEFGLPLEKVVIASAGLPEEPLVLDLKSTAISSVFNTPYFMTNEPERAKEILKVIENDPKVQEFAKVLETTFFVKDPLVDPTYQQAYKEAVESVLATLNP